MCTSTLFKPLILIHFRFFDIEQAWRSVHEVLHLQPGSPIFSTFIALWYWCDDIARPPALLIIKPLRGTNDGHYASIKRIVHFWRPYYALALWFKGLVELHWVLICESDNVAIPVIISLIDLCFYILATTLKSVIKCTRESQLRLGTFNVYIIVHAGIILKGRSTTILAKIRLRALNRANLIWTCLMIIGRQVVNGVERISVSLVLQLLVQGFIMVDIPDVEVRVGA